MDEFEQIRQLLGKDEFAKQNNIELVSIGKGEAVAKMEILPKHLNGLGSVQGGAIFTLADFALAAASNSYGVPAVGLDSNISFIKGGNSGVYFAKVKENFRRRTIANYTVEVENEKAEKIALFHSTVYIKN